MTLYAIEYLGPDGRLAHRTFAADSAFAALDEFRRKYPECTDVVELRKVHGP